MRFMLTDEQRKPLDDPWVLRMLGWSLERYLRDAPEMRFCEFVRGEVIMASPVRAEHQDLAGFLSFLLRGYCSQHDGEKVLAGPAALRVACDIIREPDLFVIPADQAHRARGVPVEGVTPSLIIEIVSPGTRAIDLGEKVEEYADLGVLEYWVIDGEKRQVHAHRLTSGRYQVVIHGTAWLESSALRGFRLDLGWLWQNPLPSEVECLRRLGVATGPEHAP